MYQIIDRKEYVKREVRRWWRFVKPKPPDEFELAMKAFESEPITAEEWAEAERELDAKEDVPRHSPEKLDEFVELVRRS